MCVTTFGVSIDGDNTNPTVSVSGEVDFAAAPALEDALTRALERGGAQINLDFREVTFLDSEGLKVLLRTQRNVRERGGSIMVSGCSRFIARTFEILGLDTQFGIESGETPERV